MKKLVLYPLCSGRFRRSQLLFIIDGVLNNASIVLTTGIFLSGYIVFLKGSDFLVGLLNNSISWTALISLFSFLIFERMKRRKTLLISLNVISRLLICSIIFVPLISADNTAVLYIVSAMVIAGNILWSIYAIGYTVWLMSILPAESRSEYLYLRTFWMRVFFTVITILMGLVLDWMHKSYGGFLVVFLLSLALSAADIFALINIDEPVYITGGDEKLGASAFFEPLKNKDYRFFLIFVFLFYVCITMASSYTPLYLIRYIKLDYIYVSVNTAIAFVFMILSTGFWGRLEVKKGIKFVLLITSLIAASELLFYSFLTDRTHFIVFLAPAFNGIGYSGFLIVLMTYRYNMMPENNKTIYEGWFSGVVGLGLLLSPIIGNFLMRRLPVIHSTVYQYSGFQLLYLISFAAGAIVVSVMLLNGEKFKKFK